MFLIIILKFNKNKKEWLIGYSNFSDIKVNRFLKTVNFFIKTVNIFTVFKTVKTSVKTPVKMFTALFTVFVQTAVNHRRQWAMDTSIVCLIAKTMLFLLVSSMYPFAHWCFRYKAAKKRWKSSPKKFTAVFIDIFTTFFTIFTNSPFWWKTFTVLVKSFHRFSENF